MDDERFDFWTRQFEVPLARRSTLGHGLAALALTALGLTAGQLGVDAKKRKKKKPKKKNTKPPTCAESCPEGCAYCWNAIVGPPICGNSANYDCGVPCASHSDCVETGFPYCIRNHTERASETLGYAPCAGDQTVPRCTNIHEMCV